MSKCSKLVLVIGIALFSNSSYAQKNSWTLGFRMGYKEQFLEKTKPSDLYIISHYGDIASPTMELNLTYNITDRLSVGSGIAYLEYYAFWGIGGDMWQNFKYGKVILKYAQIPLNVKYAFPLWKSNFSVYGKFGFNIDFLADIVSSHGYYDSIGTITNSYTNTIFDYKHTEKIHDKKINVLLNAGIGFGYRFKNGFGLSLEGEYYAGLRTMGHVFIEISRRNGTNEYTELLLIKGNYWNCSFGMSYNFKKKEKKEEVKS